MGHNSAHLLEQPCDDIGLCCGTIFVDNMRAVSDKLYAVGGYDGQERLNTVEVFDPVINRWKLVKPMLCKRR